MKKQYEISWILIYAHAFHDIVEASSRKEAFRIAEEHAEKLKDPSYSEFDHYHIDTPTLIKD